MLILTDKSNIMEVENFFHFVNANDVLIDVIGMDLVEHGIPRQVYNRADHFNSMSDLCFFQHFRLRKETVLMLLEQLEERLEYIHDL